MAQQLWLLRHGEAEPHDARPDADRPLTDRGREQSRIAGCALAALKVHVHLCFTSPKVRARDTAVLACHALGIHPLEHFKKGGIAAVRLDGARGELIALLRPRELVRICG